MRGISPPKPTPGIGGEGVLSQQTFMRYIPPSSTGLRLVDPLRSCFVAGSGKRDRKSALPFALPFVLDCVVERGEELSHLDSDVVVPHFAYAFQGLVVGQYAELGTPKRAAKAFESPSDAAGLEIKRSPMPFRVERVYQPTNQSIDTAGIGKTRSNSRISKSTSNNRIH